MHQDCHTCRFLGALDHYAKAAHLMNTTAPTVEVSLALPTP